MKSNRWVVILLLFSGTAAALSAKISVSPITIKASVTDLFIMSDYGPSSPQNKSGHFFTIGMGSLPSPPTFGGMTTYSENP